MTYYITLILGLVTCLLGLAKGHIGHDQSNDGLDATHGLVHLTSNDFDTVLALNRPTMVAFTATWCGVCQKMKPEYKRFAHAFKDEKVVIANVDVDESPELRERFSVESYPTIYYFETPEKYEDYNDPRVASSFASFMNKKAQTSIYVSEPSSYSLTLNTLMHNQFKIDAVNGGVPLLVLYYATWCSYTQKFLPDWEDLASYYRGDEDSIVFARVNGDSNYVTIDEEGVKQYPTLKFFSSQYPQGLVLQDNSKTNIIDFLNKNTNAIRDKNGKLPQNVGRVPELDVITHKFSERITLKAPAEEIKLLRDELAAAVDNITENQQYAQYYLKLADLTIQKGWDFPYFEVDRLARIVNLGDVTPKTRKLLAIRVNIARSFQYY